MIIQNDLHVYFVVIVYLLNEGIRLLFTERLYSAKHLALLIHSHLDLIQGVLYPVAPEDFPEILSKGDDLLGATIWQ